MPSVRAGSAGVILAVTATALWGVSGTAASALFSDYGMPYQSLLTIRMLLSGAALYFLLRPALPRKNLLLFLFFSFNIMAVQLTYLAAISYTNAPTATILQFTSLPMVFLYEIAAHRVRGNFLLLSMMLVTALGIFELTTSFPSSGIGLVINPIGLAFGLISALTAAIYVLLSSPMIRKFGAANSVMWGMVAGGAMSLPVGAYPTLEFFLHLNMRSALPVVLLILFVAVLGTMVAFTFFIKSMESLSATQATLTAAIEPVAAALSSLVFLGVDLTAQQYIGGVLIIVSVISVQIANAAPGQINELTIRN